MQEIYVQTMKYNGDKHYSYPTLLLAQTHEVIALYGPPGRRLLHPGRSIDMALENPVIDFYFPDRHYNVFAGFYPDGSLRRYYCNVALPPTLEDGRLTWVDLDLDLIVGPDLSYTVDDEDEFAEHTVAWGYPPSLVETARGALAELMALVDARAFPFDGTALRLMAELQTQGLTAQHRPL